MKKPLFFLLTFIIAFLIAWVAFGPRLGGFGGILISLAIWLLLSFILWQARKLEAKKLLFLGLGVLLSLFWPTYSVIESEKFYQFQLPQPFRSILDILVFTCFILALVLAAALLFQCAKALAECLAAAGDPQTVQGHASSRFLAPALIVSGLLLLKFLRNLSGLIMWDNTNDPIEVFWLFIPILVSLICGVVLLFSLPGMSRLVSLVFLFFMPALSLIIFDSAVNIDFRSMTRERGDRLSYAIQAYYQREGQYPKTLARLLPQDLTIVQPPFIIAGQSWCYDAGQDYYRLGYLNREHWSSPCYYGELISSAGDLSGFPPLCDGVLQVFQPSYDTTGIIGCKVSVPKLVGRE